MANINNNFTFCVLITFAFVCINSTFAPAYDPTTELVSLLDYSRPQNEQQRKQEAERIRQLLKAGANPNAVSIYGHIIVTAGEGKPEALQALIEAGADVNAVSNQRMTSLMRAAGSGCMECLKLLLQAHASINGYDFFGRSALSLAAENGHLEIVKELLRAKAEVNPPDGIESPLFKAAQKGYLEIVRFLIASGADLDAVNSQGKSPLMEAANSGHLEVVTALLEAGADPNVKDKNGDTALVLAERSGHLDAVQKLLQVSADEKGWAQQVLFSSIEKSVLPDESMRQRFDMNALNTVTGKTALIEAAEKGFAEGVEVLIRWGADVNIRDKGKNTALMAAAGKGYEKIVAQLVRAGADLNAQDYLGRTALILATSAKHTGVAKILVQAGADVNLVSSGNSTSDVMIGGVGTALQVASQNGDLDTVHTLIEAGANVNDGISGYESGFPVSISLWTAAKNGHTAVVSELLKAKAEPPQGTMHAAIESGNKELVSALAQAKIGLNEIVIDLSPLMLAVKEGEIEITKILLASGAEVNLRSPTGQDAIQVAIKSGRPELVELLKQSGATASNTDEASLIAAVRSDNAQAVEEIVARGLKGDWTDQEGNTLLAIASDKGNLRIVKALLKAGADPNRKSRQEITPLIPALIRHHVEVAKTLIAAGARAHGASPYPALTYAYDLTILRMLLEAGASLEEQDGNGQTALFRQATRPEILAALIDAGANVNARDQYDHTVLMKAVEDNYAAAETIPLLIAHGADPNAQDSSEGKTALMFASDRAHAKAVKTLLDHGANPHIKDRSGCTALYYALWQFRPDLTDDVVTALVGAGANVNQHYDNGETAMTMASLRNAIGAVRILLRAGARPDLQNSVRETALTIASATGNVELVKLLLASGANVNIRNKSGLTPLMLATKANSKQTADALRQAGAKE